MKIGWSNVKAILDGIKKIQDTCSVGGAIDVPVPKEYFEQAKEYVESQKLYKINFKVPEEIVIKTKVEIVNIDKFPTAFDFSYYGLSDFIYEDEIKKLEDYGVSIIIYWYGTGDYCGDGEAILKTKDGWRTASLGHCSCYGPFDAIDTGSSVLDGTTLEEIKKNSTKEYLDRIIDLLDKAKKLGYK